MTPDILKKIGFSEKAADVYLSLLSLGPSSVRQLASETKLNRGSVYDALKWLQEKDLVRFYKADTKQHFVAQHPQELFSLITEQKKDLSQSEKEIEQGLPELLALYNKGGEQPVAKYYSEKELPEILQDILSTCEEQGEHMYRAYSAPVVREELYSDFPTFSDVRVAKNISVKVIAFGEGGSLRGLDERRYLPGTPHTPTSIFIYPGKTAYISRNAKKEIVGVVIDNDGVYETQKMTFDALWDTLSS